MDGQAESMAFRREWKPDLARCFLKMFPRSGARVPARSDVRGLMNSRRFAGVSGAGTQLFDALAWLVLSLALVAVGTTFRDYGVGWDEQGETVYGALLLKYYESGFRDHSAFQFLNLRYYGGAFELPAALLARISPFSEYETRHLLIALLGLGALTATWRIARMLGGARAGVLALLLLVLNPTWYGHMFINPRDLPFAAGMVTCLWLSLRMLGELPRIRPRTSALFGGALGLTISTRVGGLLALVFLLVPVALWLAARARGARAELVRDALRIAGSLAGAQVVAYAVMAVLWPWAIQAPLNPLRALTMFSRFPFESSVLFEGRLIPARALPASYVPVLLALKLPEVLLAGLLGGALFGLYALWRRARQALQMQGGGEHERGAFAPSLHVLRVVTVVVAAAFPILYFLVARPVVYNGMRHFLFVLPPLSVLVALVFERALTASSRPLRLALGVGLALSCAAQLHTLVELFPYQYVYFNRLAGGIAGAQGRYELDYWGISLAEATHDLVRTLEENDQLPKPGHAPLKVYVCGNLWSAAEFFPPGLTAVERIEDADLQVAIAEFFCRHVPGSRPLGAVTREGAVLSFMDDLRRQPAPRPGFAQAPARPQAARTYAR